MGNLLLYLIFGKEKLFYVHHHYHWIVRIWSSSIYDHSICLIHMGEKKDKRLTFQFDPCIWMLRWFFFKKKKKKFIKSKARTSSTLININFFMNQNGFQQIVFDVYVFFSCIGSRKSNKLIKWSMDFISLLRKKKQKINHLTIRYRIWKWILITCCFWCFRLIFHYSRHVPHHWW